MKLTKKARASYLTPPITYLLRTSLASCNLKNGFRAQGFCFTHYT